MMTETTISSRSSAVVSTKLGAVPFIDLRQTVKAERIVLKKWPESFRDLDPAFNTEVEKLIDFVTQDHVEDF